MTHEFPVVADLLSKVKALAADEGARKVLAVTITMGALVPFSRQVLEEYFAIVSRGTAAEGARLHVNRSAALDSNSQHVLLEGIEVEAEAGTNATSRGDD